MTRPGRLSQRAYTISEARAEWVVFDHDGRRITGFWSLVHAVACVVALLEGRFDR
jgi:hypothetical protein